jgi:hypothetical protein
MSNPFLESILASFDSQASIVWDLTSPTGAQASFTLHSDRISVAFIEIVPGQWRVGFEIAKSSQSSSDLVRSSIAIFSGVFEAVEEFLTIRQPERLVLTSKEEGLGRLYEAYLSRQDTNLPSLGYRSEPPTKASPLAEYAIVKTTPSAWSEPQNR